ncbi:hypothetical protein D9757_001693 [Collybiopsis confluens]|uniref:Peptidase S28 n=1 Tax=Collybiopsis confluens TaxID=2823264 RepID=A0A8H5HYC9_9AGAR|nr:hypothetical protein D9757_001693 [Collybiopsis confluens]
MRFLLPVFLGTAFAFAKSLWKIVPPPQLLDFPVVGAIPSSSQALHFEMPLNHFSNLTVDGVSAFQNRYWINATYYEVGGPVFIFDSGEQNAEPLVPYYLQEYHGLSATMRLAKRYQGIAILWEHRYYGDSLPFPVNRNTTPQQWQFLTTEQALEDVVFFANSFGKNSTLSSGSPLNSSAAVDPQSLPLHPSVTPWVWLGGSYPGIRGAFLRQRNPETIFAAWASSAPVQAQVDMEAYYAAAERSLTRNCSADWVAITKYVDHVLQGDDTTLIEDLKFDLLKARLSGPGGNTTASILMDPLDFYQYYGFADSLLPFCDILETLNFTTNPVEGGIVSVSGVKDALKAFLVALAEIDYDSIPGSPDDPVQDMSWMRQYCSEYGFYQRGDPNNNASIETSFLSLELFQQQCDGTFSDHLPGWPQVGNINKYGGWHMQPSNVMFSNGEFDPWRTMGLASIEANAPQRKPSAIVPECNIPSNATSFFGITYDNMVHVSDMRVLLVPDSNHTDFKTVGFYSPVKQAPFYTGLGLFQLALDDWLPCFGKPADIAP